MIVQAIGLLDELDKEINTYAMRVKEWFGWHFPEMAKVTFACSFASTAQDASTPVSPRHNDLNNWLVTLGASDRLRTTCSYIAVQADHVAAVPCRAVRLPRVFSLSDTNFYHPPTTQ